MPNGLTNAAFLDGLTGWNSSAQLTRSVDETVRGAPGRAVLKGVGVTTANNQQQHLTTAATARITGLTAGQTLEAHCGAFAAVNGGAVAPTVRIVWFDGGGAEVSVSDLTVQAAALTTHGEGVAGLSATYRRAWGRAQVPASAVAAALRLRIAPAATDSAVELALLKPFLAVVADEAPPPRPWDPGASANVDLQLAIWPEILRPFHVPSPSEPRPAAAGFEGATGAPVSRTLRHDPLRRLNGRLRCDPVQQAALEAFHQARLQDRKPFWVVEPATERLCVARFAADGAPRVTDPRGPTSIVEVGLMLETA